ncbi:hypothetical protein HBE96_21880 [Clostridium sp. P21]|uniref:Uncharacterized protein n=1 Tax=Clostridium muellerianum TaxID=2716538 RepID=A0A7Y0HQX8_9CLOT|nr:hypothetical protein [Clostridium muellerianum]NMM65237.1 hypothetical protein [Clostridium muellerianum]
MMLGVCGEMVLELINSKISREKLYKRIYEPYEVVKTEKITEGSDTAFYEPLAEILTLIHMNK